MALDLDAFAVLGVIAENRALFADIQKDAGAAARACVVKKLKAKATDVPTLRALYAALGAESFSLVVDGLKDAELKTLIGKLDKYHPETKTKNFTLHRRQLRALAEGAAEPLAKPVKVRAVRSKAVKVAKGNKGREQPVQEEALPREAGSFLTSEAMAAVRERKRKR